MLKARTQDGKKYPPTTIRSLLSGLNRILVFPKHFSSFMASLAALSTFISLNLTHFGAFLLLPITVAHCCSCQLLNYPKLCSIVLSCALLSQTVLYYPKLCSIIPNCALLCQTVLYYAKLCSIMPKCALFSLIGLVV